MATRLGKDELWGLLVETVHSLPMYKNHKRYVQDILLKERPDVTPQQLAILLNMPLGEALVILDELHERKDAQVPPPSPEKATPTSSLLDWLR